VKFDSDGAMFEVYSTKVELYMCIDFILHTANTICIRDPFCQFGFVLEIWGVLYTVILVCRVL